MKTQILFLLSLMACLSYSQNKIVINSSKGLISNKAFSKQVLRDFNYLILDELSPTQGVSTKVAEDGTQILLSGILSNDSNRTITVNADLSSTNGIYFFDNDAGGKKASITLNYFNQYSSFYCYSKKRDDIISLKTDQLDLIVKAKRRLDSIFYNLVVHIKPDGNSKVTSGQQTSLKQLAISDVEDQTLSTRELVEKSKLYTKLSEKISDLSSLYINKDPNLGYHQIKVLDYATERKNPIQVEIRDDNENTIPLIYTDSFKKLWDLYKSHKSYIENKLESDILDSEISNADGLWNTKHMFFYSLHPFYTREDVIVFNNNSFTENRGDLFGIRLNFLNYSFEKLKGKKFKSLVRLGISAARVSNRTGSPVDLTTTSNVGIDASGNPITAAVTRSAYNNISAYDYGNRLGLHAEAYVYPGAGSLGFFGTISWQEFRFPDVTMPNYIREIPFRAGLLYNFKNQKKKKDIIVAQLFFDRLNLDKSPNQEGQEWRVGLGIGLPLSY